MSGLATLLVALAACFLSLAVLDELVAGRGENPEQVPPANGGPSGPGLWAIIAVYGLVATLAILSRQLAGRDEAPNPFNPRPPRRNAKRELI